MQPNQRQQKAGTKIIVAEAKSKGPRSNDVARRVKTKKG